MGYLEIEKLGNAFYLEFQEIFQVVVLKINHFQLFFYSNLHKGDPYAKNFLKFNFF